jgi:hypothetical protein
LQRRGGEYALHISIRYNEGAIVRNAMTNRQWGVEERSGGFPLSKAEVFDLTIVNESSSYVLLLNGKKFATFAHRGLNDDIETLEVDGNVVSRGGRTRMRCERPCNNSSGTAYRHHQRRGGGLKKIRG